MATFFFDNDKLRAFTLDDFAQGIHDVAVKGYDIIPGTAVRAGENYSALFALSNSTNKDGDGVENSDSNSESGAESVTEDTSAIGWEGITKEDHKEILEAVFQEKGIKGLREIATPLGVKGVSSEALISGILEKECPE